MKKNKFISKIFFALGLSVMVLACNDDDDKGSSVSFTGIASTTQETDAATVTIPLRDGSVSEDEIVWGGTAEVGEDYNVVGVTDEGIQLTILDDDDLEMNETIRIQIPSNQNSQHTVTIVSNCEDTENVYQRYFEGTYSAIEKYGPNPPASNWYGPYTAELVQDDLDPTKFYVNHFYDNGTRAAYVIFNLDAGTVSFPAQTPLNPGTAGAIGAGSTGTFTIEPCGGFLEITLTYDGGTWEYYLEKVVE